jgi:membrane protein
MGRMRESADRVKTTFKEWKEDDAQTWAASVAYYAIFSLAPLLVIAVAIAGFVFGEEAARGELAAQMEEFIGPAGAEVAQTTITNASQPGGGILATLVGVALLLLGASKVFTELQKGLNRIWNVRRDPDAGWKVVIQKRLAGFGLVLLFGVLLLAMLAASAAIAVLAQVVGDIPGGVVGWQALDFIVSVALIGVLFAVLFKYVPDVDVTWQDVRFGAVITAVLFVIGKILLGMYLGSGSIASAYGAASSLIVLLAWIYYSAQIFFFGAEYTQVRARREERRIEPDEHAVPLRRAGAEA